MKFLIKFEKAIMQFSLILMSTLAFSQVISRYFFKISNVWIEESTRYLMVWMVFVGMAAVARNDLHLKVDLLSIYSKKVAKIVSNFYKILLVFFGFFLCVQSWKVISFQLELGQTSPGMQIPMGFVYIGILLGSGLLVIHISAQLSSLFVSNSSVNKDKKEAE